MVFKHASILTPDGTFLLALNNLEVRIDADLKQMAKQLAISKMEVSWRALASESAVVKSVNTYGGIWPIHFEIFATDPETYGATPAAEKCCLHLLRCRIIEITTTTDGGNEATIKGLSVADASGNVAEIIDSPTGDSMQLHLAGTTNMGADLAIHISSGSTPAGTVTRLANGTYTCHNLTCIHKKTQSCCEHVVFAAQQYVDVIAVSEERKAEKEKQLAKEKIAEAKALLATLEAKFPEPQPESIAILDLDLKRVIKLGQD